MSALAGVGIYAYLYHTRLGYLTRAVMVHWEQSIATGIDAHRVSALAFGGGLALAGVAGVLAPFMLGSITPAMGIDTTNTAFAVIAMGSLGSPLGTVLGGLLYGISLMVMQTYFSSWANLLPYLLLIGILLVAPAASWGARSGVPKQALTILLPVVGALSVLPLVYSNHLLLFNVVVFLALAQGVNILYGFTGYLPFGYVGFFGAGAYGFSLVVLHLHLGPFAALGTGATAALVLALVLTPLLRLSGAYFAIANLAASQAVYQMVSNPSLTPITRGPYGISLSGVFNLTLSYAVAVGILTGALAVVVYLRTSRFGLSLHAIRNDPVSAAMAGVDVVRGRTIAWLLSALIAGLAGGVFAWRISVFYPDTVFNLEFSIFAIVFTLFGGRPRWSGPSSAWGSSTASTTPSASPRLSTSSSSTGRWW